MNAKMKNALSTLTMFLSVSVSASAMATDETAPRDYDVTASGPDGPLAGRIMIASKGAPMMLILPGSGPTDRDGNNPMGVTASSYKLLAKALADNGISTLRVDKRGMFGSVKAVTDPNNVTISDYASDARKWIDVGLNESGAKCVWLTGHSEGGLTALVTAQNPDKLCGVILLASPGRNLADTLLEQLRTNPANAPVLPDAEKVIAALRAGDAIDVAGMHPALQGLFAPSVQGFLIDMFRHDPAALAAKLVLPMLIVQGGRDIQVMSSDAEALAKGQPNAMLLTIDAMTHTLKRAAGPSPADSLATYSKSDQPVMPELIDAITMFIGT